MATARANQKTRPPGPRNGCLYRAAGLEDHRGRGSSSDTRRQTRAETCPLLVLCRGCPSAVGFDVDSIHLTGYAGGTVGSSPAPRSKIFQRATWSSGDKFLTNSELDCSRTSRPSVMV